MGVVISLSNLAAAVANQGGIGVISATGIGMLEPDFNQNFGEANKRALRREIRKVRRMTEGIIGVNIMVALTDYEELLHVAVEEGADVVFLGAGLVSEIKPYEIYFNKSIPVIAALLREACLREGISTGSSNWEPGGRNWPRGSWRPTNAMLPRNSRRRISGVAKRTWS